MERFGIPRSSGVCSALPALTIALIQIEAQRHFIDNQHLALQSLPSWAVVGSLDVLSGMQHAHDFEATFMNTVEDQVILESANRPDAAAFERAVFGFPTT